MRTHRPAPHRSNTRRAVAATVGALVLTGTAFAETAAASPLHRVPAKGAVVTCQDVGRLTGTGGYLRQRETHTVGRNGHTHVLFTIATDHVRLVASGGITYRLVGAGYDDVVYPGKAVAGHVLREVEDFQFTVAHRNHVVGAVRFHLRTGADQTTHVHDSSTCRLPHMS